jgi:hypothetical protein
MFRRFRLAFPLPCCSAFYSLVLPPSIFAPALTMICLAVLPGYFFISVPPAHTDDYVCVLLPVASPVLRLLRRYRAFLVMSSIPLTHACPYIGACRRDYTFEHICSD